MTTGIRGFNPIWSEVDLTGKQFDSTFYLYTLQNVIPYIPSTVYHDVELNQPWTDPIQFLANGTLPVDVYFVPDTIYRLEFRQNNGIDAPSQADALIYEVNNYVPNSGGITPIDTVALASSNQISNPQFALFNFPTAFTFVGDAATLPTPGSIAIGPDWVLNLAGTGTITITQVPFNDLNTSSSNAPYALRLQMSGWTANSVTLRQRFFQNGMLWANQFVSNALTAAIGSASVNVGPLNATIVDSDSTLSINVLSIPRLSTALTEYRGVGQLPDSLNTDFPPAAYIDYLLAMPSNIDVYLTSFQLVVESEPLEPNFIQDSINRQIDQTYHTAYPIVPIGTIIDFGGFTIPEHYYLCDGTAISRTGNNLLFLALTTTETVTLTSGVATFTVVSNANYHIGMAIEGTNIPAATTILNIVGTTITMSANATASGASTVMFFAWGGGDGSTTFNLPSLADYVTAGANGSLFGTGNDAVGAKGGTATTTLTGANLPVGTPYNPAAGTGDFAYTAAGPAHAPANNLGSAWQFGVATAFSTVQQTAFVKKCIRFE